MVATTIQAAAQNKRCTIVEFVGHSATIAKTNLFRALLDCFEHVATLGIHVDREGCSVPQNVPDLWWQTACEQTHMPLACGDKQNCFVWCNSAFERLTGYSAAELRGKTWMSITEQSDVGGDLASIEALKDGFVRSYSISKCYRHKRGHKVPVELSVWRFPVDGIDELQCFVSEAAPEIVGRAQVDQLQYEMQAKYDELACMVAAVSKPDKVEVNVGDRWRDGDNTRGDKNSDKTIRWLIVGLIACGAWISWMSYYQAVSNKPNVIPQAPPNVEVPLNK